MSPHASRHPRTRLRGRLPWGEEGIQCNGEMVCAHGNVTRAWSVTRPFPCEEHFQRWMQGPSESSTAINRSKNKHRHQPYAIPGHQAVVQHRIKCPECKQAYDVELFSRSNAQHFKDLDDPRSWVNKRMYSSVLCDAVPRQPSPSHDLWSFPRLFALCQRDGFDQAAEQLNSLTEQPHYETALMLAHSRRSRFKTLPTSIEISAGVFWDAHDELRLLNTIDGHQPCPSRGRSPREDLSSKAVTTFPMVSPRGGSQKFPPFWETRCSPCCSQRISPVAPGVHGPRGTILTVCCCVVWCVTPSSR